MHTPAKTALVSALCLLALAGIVGNPIAFAHAGTMFSGGYYNPEGTAGYDGQFFFYIARDGFAGADYIDGPALRYMRIAYPVAARAAVLGFEGMIPLGLIAVNIAAITATVYVLAALLSARGLSGWWALVYLAYGGTLFAFRLNLAEPLCFLLILLALVALEHDQSGRSVWWLILAALTKELALVGAAALAVHALLSRRWLRAVVLFSIPLLVWLAWLAVLRAVFGVWPWIYPAAHLEYPLAGWLAIEPLTDTILTGLWLAVPAVLLAVGASVDALLDGSRQDALLAGAGALFVLIMPRESWVDPVAALRIGGIMVLPGLLFLAAYPKLCRPLAVLWALSGSLALAVPGLFF